MALPVTVISRQPIRVGSKRSSNVIAVGAARGAASGDSRVHTRRIVERPPLPGGKVTPASMTRSGAAAPSIVSESASPTDVQPAVSAASSSSSENSPSPSSSRSITAWNVGISAWSMTTSRSTRSGSTRIPAWWLIVKLPSGWASTAVAASGSSTTAPRMARMTRAPRAATAAHRSPSRVCCARSRAAGSSAGPRARARSRFVRASSVRPTAAAITPA